ncbi:hypothetical protein BH10PLA2_BH10PLA2_05480 [soil metagenome]
MKNVEWIVPVIVFSVFVVGQLLRILNWKNEQQKKAERRPRVFQMPPQQRPSMPEPVRRPVTEVVEVVEVVAPVEQMEMTPRTLGQIDFPRPVERQRQRPEPTSEELQRAIRRNRAKAQKRNQARAAVEVPIVVPLVDTTNTRSLRDEPILIVPNAPLSGTAMALSGPGMTPFLLDLFNSPDALAKAMVLQVIFGPPPSVRGRRQV